MLAILGTLAITSLIITLMAFITRPMYYVTLVAKAIGFGFLVWHRDSNKYFYSLTYKGALEWMACTYDCATMFSNFTKEALQVKLVQKA